MSTNNKPQKTYRSWTQENLNLAINAVSKGLYTSRAASQQYGIPRTTLERRLKLLGQVKKRQGRAPLLRNYEKNIEESLLKLQKDGVKWTMADLRRLAFEYAEKHQVKHCFNKEKKLASFNWVNSFLHRHPHLCMNKKKVKKKLPDLIDIKTAERLEPICLKNQAPSVNNRCSWTEDQLIQAIESVNNGTSSCRSASKTFGIPRTTLIRHIKEGTNKKKRLGRIPMLGELENELKEFLLVEQNHGNIWSMTELRRVAFDFAETHNIKHKFNEEKGLASYEWVHAFTSRHPEIMVQTHKRSVSDLIYYNYEFCDLMQIVLEEGDDNLDIFDQSNEENL